MGGTSFFCRFSAERIWKGVAGVSSAGRKRGRGKGSSKKLVVDYNRGQKIGEGPLRIKIPFLNATQTSRALIKPEILGNDHDYKERLYKVREKILTVRKRFKNPLDRGWSGTKMPGTKIGPPEAVAGIPFEGFETIVLEARTLFKMTGTSGRVKSIGATVVTGNRNGLAGFSLANGNDFRATINNARNRAAQSLVRVNLWENHTVLHDFFSKYYETVVFVQRKPPGYGVRAHRVIRAICDVIGIKDLHAKVEGGSRAVRNVSNITKAFFLGLMKQKTYQEIADEKRLHLVELREENYNFPKILASPKVGIRHDVKSSEILDFTYYINDGKIRQVKAPIRHPFIGLPSWQKHLDYQDYVKNREATKLQFAARYQDKSVFEVFPEFKTLAFKRGERDEESEKTEQSAEQS